MASAETGQLTLDELFVNKTAGDKNSFLSQINCTVRLRIRKLESLLKKRINSKWAVIFNRACLKENIVPRYVNNIYIYIYILAGVPGLARVF